MLVEATTADDDARKSGKSDAIEPYNEAAANKATTSSSFFGNANYETGLMEFREKYINKFTNFSVKFDNTNFPKRRF